MQIHFLPDDGTGRTALRAHAEAGDRPLRADQLLLDAAPRTVDHDLVAAAATVLFAPNAGTEIGFGDEISAPLASAIQDATGLAVASKVVEPSTDDSAETGPLQVTTLAVSLGGLLEVLTPGVDRTRLQLVPGERFHGALFGVKESIIASNAWYLGQVMDPRRVQLAVGLLFARDLLAKEIETSGEGAEPWDVPAPVRTLCEALGIGAS